MSFVHRAQVKGVYMDHYALPPSNPLTYALICARIGVVHPGRRGVSAILLDFGR